MMTPLRQTYALGVPPPGQAQVPPVRERGRTRSMPLADLQELNARPVLDGAVQGPVVASEEHQGGVLVLGEARAIGFAETLQVLRILAGKPARRLVGRRPQ